MATPQEYTLALLDFAGNTISDYIRQNVSTDKRLLDVGAGWGKYRFLLPEYEMDAIEVWTPYIAANGLNTYYRNVYAEDICDFEFKERYGAITMGDVLEHIAVEQAQKVVDKLCDNADYVCIAVPFEMEQEAVEGNYHEEHQQDDLTEEVMAERFPRLTLYKKFGRPNEHVKAIYIKGK